MCHITTGHQLPNQWNGKNHVEERYPSSDPIRTHQSVSERKVRRKKIHYPPNNNFIIASSARIIFYLELWSTLRKISVHQQPFHRPSSKLYPWNASNASITTNKRDPWFNYRMIYLLFSNLTFIDYFSVCKSHHWSLQILHTTKLLLKIHLAKLLKVPISGSM